MKNTKTEPYKEQIEKATRREIAELKKQLKEADDGEGCRYNGRKQKSNTNVLILT